MMFWRTLCDVCLDTNLRKAKLERKIAYIDARLTGYGEEYKREGHWYGFAPQKIGKLHSDKLKFQYELDKLNDE